jgi:hypothetical protein
MSKRTLLKGLALFTPVILVALAVGGFMLSRGEQTREAEQEAAVHSPVRITLEDGLVTLTVDAAAQAASGIQVRALSATEGTPGAAVYGTVMDLQPLADLSSRYAATRADLDAAKVAADTAKAELDRTQTLYADVQNASLKTLQAARAASIAATAKVKSTQASLDATVTAARQQYGTAIAGWITSPASADLARLLDRRDVLLRVVFPGGQSSAAPALLKATGDGVAPFEARLVSASPQTDPGIQGQTYYYRAATQLGAGARISARVPAVASAGASAKAGVLVPAGAIVWYGGQPWAYVHTGKHNFQRRAVDARFAQDGDFFVADGFKPGDRVVVRGAQLLLSEESRAQGGSQPDND